MKAMILAAGRGMRMMPLTSDTPKPMLTVLGKPLIQYHLERLKNAGITDIVINLAWQGHKIIDYFGNGSKFGVKINYSQEPVEGFETAGGIASALKMLTGKSDTFIVINGDIFTDYDVHSLTQLVIEPNCAHIVLVENPEHNKEGDFSLNAQNNDLKKYTFSGIGLYDVRFFNGLEEKISMPLGPMLKKAILRNYVSTELYLGVWHDIGTPKRLVEINHNLERK